MIHHVQVACPTGAEDDQRAFYTGVLGWPELPKPPLLAARGGCWFAVPGGGEVHVGVEADFRPARKAHPGLLVSDLDALEERLTAAGYGCVRTAGEEPGQPRFHAHDCFGNRVEFLQA